MPTTDIPFFPVTIKHVGDTVRLPKHPASYFCGQSNDEYIGTVQRDGSVAWKGEHPTHYHTDIRSEEFQQPCLIK